MLKKQPIQQIIANFPREGEVSVYDLEAIFKLYFDYINPIAEGGSKEDEDSLELHKQNYITLLKRSSRYLQPISDVKIQRFKTFFAKIPAPHQLDFYKKFYTIIIDQREKGQKEGVFSVYFVDGLRQIYKEKIEGGIWYEDDRFENTKDVIQKALKTLHEKQTTAVNAFTKELEKLATEYTHKGKPKYPGPLSFLNIEEKALKQLNALQATVLQYKLETVVKPQLFANLLLIISDMAGTDLEKGVAKILKPCIKEFLTSAEQILGFPYLKYKSNPFQGKIDFPNSFLKLLETHIFKEAQHEDKVKSIALRIALLDDAFFSLMMLFPRLHDSLFSVDPGEVTQTYIEVMKNYYLEDFRNISDGVLNDKIKTYLEQSTSVQPPKANNVQPPPSRPAPPAFFQSPPPAKAPVSAPSGKPLGNESSQLRKKEEMKKEVKERKGKEKISGYQLTDDDLNIAIERFYSDNSQSIEKVPLGLLPVRVSILKPNVNIPRDREISSVIEQLSPGNKKAYCGIVHHINHYFFIMVSFDKKATKHITIIDPENECKAKAERQLEIKEVLGNNVRFIDVAQQPEGDGAACGIFSLANLEAFFKGNLLRPDGTVDENQLAGKNALQEKRECWEAFLEKQKGKVTFPVTPKIFKTIEDYDFLREKDQYFKNIESGNKESAIVLLEETFSEWLENRGDDAQISPHDKEKLIREFRSEVEMDIPSLTELQIQSSLDKVFDKFIEKTETFGLKS